MLILSIETSTSAFSVSIYKKRELANINFVYNAPHSQHIVKVVQFLLESIGATVKDITNICAGIGPGSFTGIRIGLSFANTLSQVLSIPIFGVTSLDLLAFENNRWNNPVIPFIRSRRNEVYTAFYKNGKKVTDYLVLNIEEFHGFIVKNNPFLLISSEDDYKDIVLDSKINKLSKKVFSYPKASVIYPLVKEYGLESKKCYLKPLYVHGV